MPDFYRGSIFSGVICGPTISGTAGELPAASSFHSSFTLKNEHVNPNHGAQPMKIIASFAALALIASAPALAQPNGSQNRTAQDNASSSAPRLQLAQANNKAPAKKASNNRAPAKKATNNRAPAKKATNNRAPAKKAQVQNRQTSRVTTPPRSWRGTSSAYQTHVRKCQSRYRSYNPRTNTYTVRPGQTAICR